MVEPCGHILQAHCSCEKARNPSENQCAFLGHWQAADRQENKKKPSHEVSIAAILERLVVTLIPGSEKEKRQQELSMEWSTTLPDESFILPSRCKSRVFTVAPSPVQRALVRPDRRSISPRGLYDGDQPRFVLWVSSPRFRHAACSGFQLGSNLGASVKHWGDLGVQDVVIITGGYKLGRVVPALSQSWSS